ncbi:MAG: AAA family ATPase [Proteobacteria bacterium]|nr:AAA family ATPase [Pseudomonadota bacterium]
MDLNDARHLARDELNQRLAERQAQLARVARELKAELIGLDDVIDRVIDAVRAWYVLPELITRPVIVCLWGLTGTGKTQLTRLLAHKLGFLDRFVEVQMDGFSNSGGWYTPGSISGMLADSGIAEGEPGILLLDEFQRYRTIDDKRQDLKVERYQDVWALLSDGRLSPELSFLQKLDFRLASAQFDAARRTEDEADDEDDVDASADATAPATKAPKARKFSLDPWDARELKRALKLTESLVEIMGWSALEVQSRVEAFRTDSSRWQTDYSRLLIFITGNLDGMYEQLAQAVDDCDTDADVFHAMTRKLSVIDVKSALGRRFRPEQVARLGNQHLVYPSLSRRAYQALIARTCAQYVDEIRHSSGIDFAMDEAVLAEIYDNAVFPAQGTRPVFSSVHAVLGGSLVKAALWAIERGAEPGSTVAVALGADRCHLVARTQGAELSLPVNFELQGLRQRRSLDFRTLLAVHEAGHGLVHALLSGRAPQEIRINVASFNGGYNSYDSPRAWSRRMIRGRICTGLAGRAAECVVFGRDASTTGAEADYRSATAEALRYVRHWGFGSRIGRTDVASNDDENLNTDVAPTNAEAEALLNAESARAAELIRTHAQPFRQLVQRLMDSGAVSAAEFGAVTGLAVNPPASDDSPGPEDWHARWKGF